MRSIITLVISLATLSITACTSATADTPSPVATQIEKGKKLYLAKCASCHGRAGEGKKDAPPVVGKNAFPLDPRPKAKRAVKFRTAADVFAWTVKYMPAKKPGSLSTDEYLAIFAFDLTANGIKLDKPLDAAAAAKIVLHE